MNNEKNNKYFLEKLKENIKKIREELNHNQINNCLSESQKIKKLKTEPESLKLIDDLEQEINLLFKDNLRLQEEKLLALADSENLKKRLYKEIIDIKRYKSAGIAEKLLLTLDSFERALEVNNVTLEVKNFLTGFEMIHRMFKTALNEEGIIVIETKAGERFNSNFHSAIEIVEDKQLPAGCVVKILQKGYMIHDRVLRHVSVQVSK